MGQLTCMFVPLVFSELYKLLASEQPYSNALEDRLAGIQLPVEWLVEASEAYEAKWKSDLEYLTLEEIDSYALSEQHAQFAAWLLAGLRLSSGTCAELSADLESMVMARALEEVGAIQTPLPAALSPTVIGWTLGCVIGRGGSDLPVVPAIWPSDDNVRAAFKGLIEHVLTIQDMDEPLPELMQSAMYWRGYGLAEALRPEASSGGPALTQLRLESFSTMADAQRLEIGRHLDGFNERRNALSHIADDQSRLRFIDVLDEFPQSSGVNLTMRAMTHFVFHDVARNARDNPPRVVRQGTWESLAREIQVWS